MALTYTRKVATAVAVGDVISALTDQNNGGRVYKVHGTAGPDERPTVVSVVQVLAPNETNSGVATGPVNVALTGGSLSASSPQTLVLAPSDTVVVSTGTAAAADV